MNEQVTSRGGRAPTRKSRCGLQDRVRTWKLADFLLQLREALRVAGGGAGGAGIDLRLTDPAAQPLGVHAELIARRITHGPDATKATGVPGSVDGLGTPKCVRPNPWALVNRERTAMHPRAVSDAPASCVTGAGERGAPVVEWTVTWNSRSPGRGSVRTEKPPRVPHHRSVPVGLEQTL